MSPSPICADYALFLESFSEDLTTDKPLPKLPWSTSTVSRPSEEVIAQRESARAFFGVARVFGAVAFAAYHEDLESQFWHPEFLRFGYVVGISKDGDPIVQACSGKHMGRVYLTDHNFYFSWVEQLVDGEDLDEIEEELERIGFETFDTMTADQFFDLMTMELAIDGLFVELGSSFSDFYLACCREYGTEIR